MVNHYQGQYDVINAVYQQTKFKNMLYIAGKENGYITILRTEAAKDFCFDQDIKITIKDGNFNEFLAYEIAKNDAYKYDAIICASDLMAIGVKRALKEKNLNIPIAGFDGISLMGYVADDILTVKQDFYEISQIAFQKIVNLVTGVEEPSLTFVPYEVTKINRDDLKY